MNRLKTMNITSGTCGTVTEDLTVLVSESQKERRKRLGVKITTRNNVKNFPNLAREIKLIKVEIEEAM